MKIAEIDWPLFWHAFDQQDSLSCGPWLARWVFADDRVRLSMRPEDATVSSDPSVETSQTSKKDRVAPVKLYASESKPAMHGRTKLDAGSKQHVFYVID
jgi:hypothetical protein